MKKESDNRPKIMTQINQHRTKIGDMRIFNTELIKPLLKTIKIRKFSKRFIRTRNREYVN